MVDNEEKIGCGVGHGNPEREFGKIRRAEKCVREEA
jgi:hypothetical protein